MFFFQFTTSDGFKEEGETTRMISSPQFFESNCLDLSRPRVSPQDFLFPEFSMAQAFIRSTTTGLSHPGWHQLPLMPVHPIYGTIYICGSSMALRYVCVGLASSLAARIKEGAGERDWRAANQLKLPLESLANFNRIQMDTGASSARMAF